MKSKNKYFGGAVALFVFALFGSYNKEEMITEKSSGVSASLSAEAKKGLTSPAAGYVYTMSNEQTQNSILCFAQHANGTLNTNQLHYLEVPAPELDWVRKNQ